MSERKAGRRQWAARRRTMAGRRIARPGHDVKLPTRVVEGVGGGGDGKVPQGLLIGAF